MSGPLIVPIVQTATRFHLALENDDGGMASVEVMNDGETVSVKVSLDDDCYPVDVRVVNS